MLARFALLLLSALCASCAEQDGPGVSAACTVTPVQSIALVPSHRHILADVRINTTDIPAIVDTGAEKSAVTATTMTRLGLLADPRNGEILVGVGGEGYPQNDVLVDRFEFGSYDPGAGHYAVIALHQGGAETAPGALLGADVLSHFDLDLDVANNRLVLYRVRHCGGNFLPWTGAYDSLPLDETMSGALRLTVKVDGRPMRALLDSGAGATIIDSDAAARIGLTAAELAKENAGQGSGAAGVNFMSVRHRFHDLQIGAEHFADPELFVLDRPLQQADMLLGIDYLRQRHVWISYRTHRLFVAQPQS